MEIEVSPASSAAVLDDVAARVEDVLLCFLAALRRYAPTDGTGSRSVPGWYRGALRALVAAGVIDSPERARWIARAREALGGAPEPEPPSAALRRRAATLVSRTSEGVKREELLELLAELGILIEDQPGPIPQVMLPMPAFARKVSLSGKALERAIVTDRIDGDYQLEGIYLHPFGLVTQVSGPAPDDPDESASLHSGWRVRDDLGTEYQLIGVGTPVGAGPRRSETRHYAPAVPDGAGHLFITVGWVEAQVAVDGRH